MNKPKESLTAPKKVGNLANLSFSERLNLRETMSQMEAVEWKKRYRKKAMEEGNGEAYHWWLTVIEDIGKRRSLKAAQNLRDRMNNLKETND
jgi:hypothetical protein